MRQLAEKRSRRENLQRDANPPETKTTNNAILFEKLSTYHDRLLMIRLQVNSSMEFLQRRSVCGTYKNKPNLLINASTSRWENILRRHPTLLRNQTYRSATQ